MLKQLRKYVIMTPLTTMINVSLLSNILFVSTLLGMTLIPFTLTAQIPDTTEFIIFKVSPDPPNPEESVTIRVESFLLDLNRTSLTWTVDGIVVTKDSSDREITITMGESGTSILIELIVQPDSGGFFTKSIRLRPASVDLIWEADTYTPPFYKGKALPSPRSNITLTAIPTFISDAGVKIKTDDLIYTWKKGNRILGSKSGRGKNILSREELAAFGKTIVSVRVETLDSSLQAREIISIPVALPFILFYENDPLLGVRYEKAIENTFKLTKEEISIGAHPFYFSGRDRNSTAFSYGWRLNSDDIDTGGGGPSNIVLRPTGGSGEATLQLFIQNQTIRKILQQARGLLTIMFDTSDKSVVPSL